MWPVANQASARLGLAVSGGPDSLALLLLATATLPGRCEVATVNHGLRAEAEGEAAMVAGLCARLGVPCTIATVTVPAGNIQQGAREARYAAFAEWAERGGIAAVATAHHADDQAETLVMRLNRGSGLSGLAGIRSSRPLPQSDVPLVRPLLGWRKAELEQIVAAAGLSPVRDPSNSDARFERARLRPALAAADFLTVEGFAASASHLAEAAAALDWACDQAWALAVQGPRGWAWEHCGEPSPIVAGVIARGVAHAGGKAIDIGEAVRLAERIGESGKGNLGGVLVTRRGTTWHFAPEPPRRG